MILSDKIPKASRTSNKNSPISIPTTPTSANSPNTTTSHKYIPSSPNSYSNASNTPSPSTEGEILAYWKQKRIIGGYSKSVNISIKYMIVTNLILLIIIIIIKAISITTTLLYIKSVSKRKITNGSSLSTKTHGG